MDRTFNLLPPLLQEFAKIIGEPNGVASAIKISEMWPGVRRYIPIDPPADHPLSMAIGWDSAKKLGAIYGGENPIIPRLDKYWRHIRDEDIFTQLDTKKATGTEMALKYGVRSDTAYAIYARIKRERSQGDLFNAAP